MGYDKKREKLEELSAKLSSLKTYDNKSLLVITDIFEAYSHSIRILKNKNPEAFNHLYETELQEVKLVRRSLKVAEEADRQEAFTKFKDSLLAALNSAIKQAKETV